MDAPVIHQIQGKLKVAKWLRVGTVHWRVSKVAGPHAVRIYSSLGYCAGDELPPRFAGYRLSGRGRNLYITPYAAKLKFRHGKAYSAKVMPQGKVIGGRLSFPVHNEIFVCRGVGYYPYAVLKLNQRVKVVKLYDATTSPPSLRWSQSMGVS